MNAIKIFATGTILCGLQISYNCWPCHKCYLYRGIPGVDGDLPRLSERHPEQLLESVHKGDKLQLAEFQIRKLFLC